MNKAIQGLDVAHNVCLGFIHGGRGGGVLLLGVFAMVAVIVVLFAAMDKSK